MAILPLNLNLFSQFLELGRYSSRTTLPLMHDGRVAPSSFPRYQRGVGLLRLVTVHKYKLL